jgi:hypothetical protein
MGSFWGGEAEEWSRLECFVREDRFRLHVGIRTSPEAQYKD